MQVLVLGGYGFIGLEIARRIIAAGHAVTGLGRSIEMGMQLLPTARWISADMAKFETHAAWRDHLDSVDVVVNACGALQSGLNDDVEAVHYRAIAALICACESYGVRRFVQISAVGAAAQADTAFMRSKARADAFLRSSSLDWIILRPGLVIGRNAYGGTALIRMLASVPLVQPLVFDERLVQTVALADVADNALDAATGALPAGFAFDLVEDEPHSFRSLVDQFRQWLGIAPARWEIRVPDSLVYAVARLADVLGLLGWRSPLRTTAIRVLAENIVGVSEEHRAASSRTLSSLPQTLAGMPSTLQERWFARLYLILPMMVAVLALVWVLSGLIAIFSIDEAAAIVAADSTHARWAVWCGSVIDIALGGAILYRPWASTACWGMAVTTLVYLAVGTTLRPDLWLDPLGSFVKTLPVLMLAIATGLLLAERR